MKRADVIVNSESTLKRWLYAFEYHRDASKAQELETILAACRWTRPVQSF